MKLKTNTPPPSSLSSRKSAGIKPMRLIRNSKKCHAGLSLSLAASILLSGQGSCDSDERQVVSSPTTFPWYTCTKVRLGTEGKGRGSGILVSKCTILTNGHVVYNRKKEEWRPVFSVHPGSYYDETLGAVVDPYGNRPDVARATNTQWIETGNSKYDYGAIIIGDSFEDMGINTYIPVCFDESPHFINLSGYPSEFLPSSSTGSNQEQWRGFGNVKEVESRTISYEATSTGGASGAGVWIYYSTGERYLVAINRGHHNSDNDGNGVRLVSENESNIRKWMQRDDCCGNGGDPGLSISFQDLLENRADLFGRPINLTDPDSLQLVPPPPLFMVGQPTRKVMQWIEGTFYEWQEFHLPGDDVQGLELLQPGQANGTPPQRYIKLLSPEQRLLSQEEASVLLSASLLWQQPSEPSAPVIYQGNPDAIPLIPLTNDDADSDEPESSISYSGEHFNLRIVSRNAEHDSVTLAWDARDGSRYRIQTSLDLTPGSWSISPGQASLTFERGEVEVEVPTDSGASQQYFRVVELP